MVYLRILIVVLVTQFFMPHAEAGKGRCLATQFAYKGDKWAGTNFHCLKRKVDDQTPGIAMRFVRCGTEVRICRMRKTKEGKTLCTVVPVVDHGPYGAVLPKGSKCPKQAKGYCKLRKDGRLWYVKRHRDWPGEWVGCVDLTPPTARAIQHNGYEYVTVEPLRRKKRPPKKVAVLPLSFDLTIAAPDIFWCTNTVPVNSSLRPAEKDWNWK
jgi:hypothetical protein